MSQDGELLKNKTHVKVTTPLLSRDIDQILSIIPSLGSVNSGQYTTRQNDTHDSRLIPLFFHLTELFVK